MQKHSVVDEVGVYAESKSMLGNEKTEKRVEKTGTEGVPVCKCFRTYPLR